MPTPDELYGFKQTPTTGRLPTPDELYGGEPVEDESDSGFLEEVPQTVGGIGGGIAGAIKGGTMGAAGGPLGAVGGAFVGGAIGAAVGGAGAKGYQLAYKSATGAEDAPKDSYDAAIKIAMAGGEEAAWDLGGQLGARALGKIAHFIRPKAVDDIEKLAIKLEKSGGQLSAAQRTDSWMIHQLDSLTRGSLTGSGRMKALDSLNEVALKTIESELRQNISKNVTRNLSDHELGQLFMDTVRGGRAAHRTVVGELYGGFDDLVPVRKVQQYAMKEGFPEVTENVVKPVSTKALKEKLAPFRKQLENIKFVGESADSKKLLDGIFAQDATLSFSDAQALRSNLLDAQRNLNATVGKSKISSKVNSVVDGLTKAMDDAALKESPKVQAKYQAIKRYASKGYDAFDNKFISDLVVAEKKNPERIGEYIFSTGNVTEIAQVKKALRTAAVFGKKEGISYDKTWKQMQSGYLDSVLSRSSKASELPINAGVGEVSKKGLDISGKKLLAEFSDPKKQRTLSTVFSKEQRESILEYAQIAERTQRTPEGGLGILMQLTQGGAIIGAVSGNLDPAEAGLLLLSPTILARVMTNPKGARLLATALKTPAGKGASSAIMAKLAGMVHRAQSEDETESSDGSFGGGDFAVQK